MKDAGYIIADMVMVTWRSSGSGEDSASKS